MNQQEETIRLVSALIDETISVDDRKELVKRLKTDAGARDIYLEMMQTDSIMEWCASTNLIDIPAVAEPIANEDATRFSIRRKLFALQCSLAGVLLLCGLLLVALYLKEGATTVVAAEGNPLSEGGAVAVITHAENAEWVKTNLVTTPGKPLQSGWLKLSKGRVHLDFLDGTKMILEGPVELGLNSINHAFLKSGRLSIRSNSKANFTLETDLSSITSTSAQIGLQVDDDQQTEVHTFSGKANVRLHNNRQQRTVAASEAILFSSLPDNVVTQMKAEQKRFSQFLEEITQQPSQDQKYLTFTKGNTQPYSFQDGQHNLPTEMEILSQGNTLKLTGNSWKRLEVNTTLTPNSVIEFEFRTSREGQIHGFGFDDNNHFDNVNTDVIFQIYGYEIRQGVGQQFNNYSGTKWQTYRIRVGRYVTGKRKYLFFTADDDVTAKAESLFRNVRLYESSAGK